MANGATLHTGSGKGWDGIGVVLCGVGGRGMEWGSDDVVLSAWAQLSLAAAVR